MIPVKPSIQKTAHVRSMQEYEALYRRSIDDPDGFWREQSELLTWFHPPQWRSPGSPAGA